MADLRTPLCHRLGIAAPIVLAPMGGAVGPRLAAAVAEAGGLGMLGLSWTEPATMREEIRATRRLTGRPFGINLKMDADQTERLAVALDEGVRIVSLFWGNPAPYVARVHDGGGMVLHTVASAEEARRSVAAGADVIVAQGWEAGGHVLSEVTTLALVPRVVDAVAPVPVIAAGGIADGRGLAAALALGAQAAWVGTRFLACAEANTHEGYRAMLIGSAETATVHTELYDIGWPDAPHRVLRNSTYDAWVAAGSPPPGRRPGEGDALGTWADGRPIVRYDFDSPRPGDRADIEAMCLYAGQGVGLVTEVLPAAEIVGAMVAEAAAVLDRLNRT